MSTSAGRVLTALTRTAFSRGTFLRITPPIISRPDGVRPLALSSQRTAQPKNDDDDKVIDEPIKFSTSKASHRTWKVDRSMGSRFQRPWWKVLPISVLGTVFLLWCALRGQSNIDAHLEKKLFETLPGLVTDEEPEQSKST